MLSNEKSTLNADAVAWMPTKQVWAPRLTQPVQPVQQDYSKTESDIGNDYENKPRPDYDEINYRIWEDETETSSALDQDQDQDLDQMEEDPYYASIDALLEEIAQIDVFMETRREEIWLLNYLKDTRDSDVSVAIDPIEYETFWV